MGNGVAHGHAPVGDTDRGVPQGSTERLIHLLVQVRYDGNPRQPTGQRGLQMHSMPVRVNDVGAAGLGCSGDRPHAADENTGLMGHRPCTEPGSVAVSTHRPGQAAGIVRRGA